MFLAARKAGRGSCNEAAAGGMGQAPPAEPSDDACVAAVDSSGGLSAVEAGTGDTGGGPCPLCTVGLSGECSCGSP